MVHIFTYVIKYVMYTLRHYVRQFTECVWYSSLIFIGYNFIESEVGVVL